MKKLISIALISILLSCAATNKTFTVIGVQQGKDGKTLFLRDKKDRIYTTVISIPNGNFIDVKVNDSISLHIEKTIKTDSNIIISKDIKIISQ